LLATEGGQLNLVKYLCKTAIKDLQKTHILQAFFCAATSGSLDVMKFLWHLNPQAVGGKMIAHALQIVSQHEHLTSIEYLGNLVISPGLRSAAEFALMHAIAHRQILVIQRLCNILNAPPREKIEKAFKRGNLSLTESLCRLLNQKPSQGSRSGEIRRSASARELTQWSFFNLESPPKRHHSSSDSLLPTFFSAGDGPG
jgi:hypothetical protein